MNKKLFRCVQTIAGAGLMGAVIDGAIFGSAAELHGLISGLFIGFVMSLDELGVSIEDWVNRSPKNKDEG